MLRVAGYVGDVFYQVANQYNDDSQAYDSYVQFAYLYKAAGWVHHYGAYGIRCLGSGSPTFSAYVLDSDTPISLPGVTLSTTAGREYIRPINVNNEKCSARIFLDTVDKYIKIREFTLYIQPVWETRPF